MARHVQFGDNVRVRYCPATDAIDMALRVGQVHGVTTPSVTGIEYIGSSVGDCAFNVCFPETAESLWFAPEVLELVDHAPGTEIRLQGIPKKWTRAADGSREEENMVPRSPGDRGGSFGES